MVSPDKQIKISTKYHKGQSGNPNGRPKKQVCVTSWLKEYASALISSPIDANNLTFAQAAALSAWKKAAKGELDNYNFIIERIEGKAVTQVDVTSKGEQLKSNAIFNIVNPDTKVLIERLEHGGRQTTTELNGDISQEPKQLLESANTPISQ
jgi:hypothetical protein